MDGVIAHCFPAQYCHAHVGETASAPFGPINRTHRREVSPVAGRGTAICKMPDGHARRHGRGHHVRPASEIHDRAYSPLLLPLRQINAPLARVRIAGKAYLRGTSWWSVTNNTPKDEDAVIPAERGNLRESPEIPTVAWIPPFRGNDERGGHPAFGVRLHRAPYLLRHLDAQAQLGPLLLLAQQVAFLRGGEAALRAQRKLLQRQVSPAASIRRFSASLLSNSPVLLVTRPSTTSLLPRGTKRSGSNPPARSVSYSMK